MDFELSDKMSTILELVTTFMDAEVIPLEGEMLHGDPATLERNVQIGADEDALAGDVGLADRARELHGRQRSRWTRSTSRELYPHSLSYQAKTLTSGPLTIVRLESKVAE